MGLFRGMFSTRKPRLLNMAGLVGGFGVGQGSLILAQTWLLASGNIDLFASFSVAFTFAILAYQAVDLGGLVILARRVAEGERDEYDLKTYYWSFSVVRLVAASLLSVVIILWSLDAPDEFNSNYAVGAVLGVVALSLNPGGLLDGANKSGWNGLTWAFPFVASTIALPFSVELSPAYAGMLLGVALSVGGCAAVCGQYLLLKYYRLYPPLTRPTSAAMSAAWREGALYTAGWIPGQLYFRGQIAIAMIILGPLPTALLIYGKQVVMSATRLLYFARRVEYPRLVKHLSENQGFFWTVLFVQKWSIGVSIAATFALAAIGLGLHRLFPTNLHDVGVVIALFSPVVLTSSLNATFMQACYALRRTDVSAWTSILIVPLGLLMQAVMGKVFGISGIVLAEVVSQLAGAAVIIVVMTMSRTRRMHQASCTNVDERRRD